MNKLFIGIDVGSRINAVYIMLPDGSKHSSFTVQNNLGGAQSLSKRVVAALKEYNISTVLLGMEATSVYGDNLACFLREDGALGRFEKRIHVLNPKQVNEVSKDAYPDLPKNDAIDAFVIADNLRFGRSPLQYTRMITDTKPSRHLPEPVSRLSKSYTRKATLHELPLHEMLWVAQEKVFSNTYGSTALAH